MQKLQQVFILGAFSIISLYSCSKQDAMDHVAAPKDNALAFDYTNGSAEGEGFNLNFTLSGSTATIDTNIVFKIANPIVNLGHVVFFDKVNLGGSTCFNCHSAPPVFSPVPVHTRPFVSPGRHPEIGLPDVDMLVSKMSGSPWYPALFKAAYGTADITPMRISQALSQYMAVQAVYGEKGSPRFTDPY